MEELEAEVAVLPGQESGLSGLEADVAPGVEIEVREPIRAEAGIEASNGDGGEVARALDDVLVAERRRPSGRCGGASVCASPAG